MKNKMFSGIIILIAIAFFSCKKEYTIGGSVSDPHVDMTTYDYLKTNPLFDTLLLLIDRTGLKDELNSSGTFFAFTDYAIQHYVDAKREDEILKRNDENLVYTFDSLDFTALKDSVRAYIFKDEITRDNTTSTGRIFKSNDGELRLVQLIPSGDYTDGTVFSTPPKYIYLNKMIATENGYPVPIDSTGIPGLKPGQLLKTLCQTTGIITTTGVLHVLSNSHTFTYYADDKN
ncbi:hypothetical protein SAMN05518672_104142 [Chitinophaga sp. CF118]|uniref:hypothetical protein n=1 Tax=Chitinophaga sp. CF118 TaxID=1884367 RepID=UPI0008DF34D5|nr:hypothetical protein [Chitinophaga sp. CF118]SFE01358.1 hypothetical protein SAMN05518672_104142 [Chitinophaga sp. CF118]